MSKTDPEHEAACTSHEFARASGFVSMWTVYDRPSDYPLGFVARLHVVTRGSSRPTTAAVHGDTLAAVRNKLPPGLICLARQRDDEPQIVETWI